MSDGNDVTLDVMHCSMQFSDSKAQKQHDAQVIFDRATKRKIDWITGTEAGEEPLLGILREQAKNHGYRFTEYKSNWIAVAREITAAKSYSTEHFTVVDNDLTAGIGHDTSLLVAHFTHTELNRKVSVMCSHYPRFGDPGRVGKLPQPNLKYTKQIADFIGTKAKQYGAGRALVFYAGDQNIQDNRSDTFFGNPMTSLGDELGKHPSTGHGPIDVIASYDKDRRVKGVYWRSLSDRELPLNTDHWPVEGGFAVRVGTTNP